MILYHSYHFCRLYLKSWKKKNNNLIELDSGVGYDGCFLRSKKNILS